MADLDDLRRDQLPADARAVADALDDWVCRRHGILSIHHGAGLFLRLLAEEGYEVRPVAERRVLEAAREHASAWRWDPQTDGIQSTGDALVAAVDALDEVEADNRAAVER